MSFKAYKRKYIILLLLHFHFHLSQTNPDQCAIKSFYSHDDWIGTIIPYGYHSREPPDIYGPAEVFVKMKPLTIRQILIDKMTFEVDFYLSCEWTDCRLNLSTVNVTSNTTATVDDDIVARLWVPLLEFRNCVGCSPISYKPSVNRVERRGKTFIFTSRHAAQLTCKYDLTRFPMDSQVCNIEIQSFAKNDRVMLWQTTSAEDLEGINSPYDFDIEDINTSNCTYEGYDDFSCVSITFTLRRYVSFHIILSYIPSGLIVILSWISFWLHPDYTPARTALGLTSLLTLTTQMSSIEKSLPPVSYLKAIDVWMFSCMFWVVLSLVEFAVANYVHRRKKAILEPLRQWVESPPDLKNDKTVQLPNGNRVRVSEILKKNDENRMDNISRIIFPVSFLIMNITYWLYYIVFSKR